MLWSFGSILRTIQLRDRTTGVLVFPMKTLAWEGKASGRAFTLSLSSYQMQVALSPESDPPTDSSHSLRSSK